MTLSHRAVIARRLLAAAGFLLALAVLAQVLLAGLAVFAGPAWWARHRAFVHAFEWLAPLAVVLAYLGRCDGRTKALAWLTVLLLFVQYVTVGSLRASGHLGLAAVHPVSAVLLFWTAAELARAARGVGSTTAGPEPA